MEVFESTSQFSKNEVIKVVGVGGGGNNAVNRMIEDGIKNIEFIALNTDAKVLDKSKADKTISLGQKLTNGRGAGGNAEIGRKSAEETKSEIESAIGDAELVFITAGMGGGTGTGAAPIVAEIAKSKGSLTIGVVTTPFKFEGSRRMNNALTGIAELKNCVDSLIVIPNEKLVQLSGENLNMKNAFKKADEILVQGVRGIYDIIFTTSDINVDFSDICTVTRDKGIVHMGVGTGSGKNRTELAIKMAINSPLIDTSIAGAKYLLINFTTDPNTTFNDIDDAVEIVREFVHPDVDIYFGCTIDETVEDLVNVTIIATDLDDNKTKYNTSLSELGEPIRGQQFPNDLSLNQPQQPIHQDLYQQQPQYDQQYTNPAQYQPNQYGQDPYQTGQFNTNQINTVNYDTSPSIQPVNYDSDRQQPPTGQRANRFKIHGIFSQGGANGLPDIDK